MVSNDKGIAFLKFTGVDNYTSEAAARVRTEIFKSFLTSAGCSNFTDPHIACNSIIDKKVEVCLAKREYWTTDKDTNKPEIKSRVEYKFANPYGRKIAFKESYNKPMSAEERSRYEEAVRLSAGGGSTDVEDKFKLEFRMLGFTFIELKIDISRRCFKFVLLNVGIATNNCDC
jgi:hypothetical protein